MLECLELTKLLGRVFQNLPNALGFCDILSFGDRVVCINPDGGGSRFVWGLAWPRDIMEDLVSWSNLRGKITN